jgi:drug/metabolite transporter (DMT)-like permease
MTPREGRRPIASGGAFALASAVAFGGATPFVQRAGRQVGPFTTAALLYAGAALLAAAWREGASEEPVRARDLPRIAVVAGLGAVAAPVALAWGLQRTSGVVASLLLSLEALFTVLLARALWAEPIGGRVAGAIGAMTAGGALLVAGNPAQSSEASWGALAVLAATLGWASDSALSRPLSERDPSQVVLVKSVMGTAASAGLAWVAGERAPAWPAALALAACGAVGYGLALRLYLRAQRAIGAARTGAVFAAAPFVGAAIAWAMGERPGGVATLLASLLCAAGLGLQLTEGHEHLHEHGAIEHDHVHAHDDGHHDHPHEPPPAGPHAHPHRHEAVAHAHPHGLDVHHRHKH